MSRNNPNPFFDCAFADLQEHQLKERTRKALEIEARKRAEKLAREGRVETNATSETHNGVTYIVVQERKSA